MMKFFSSVLLLSASTALCALAPIYAAQAQATFDVTILAGACANCHGTDGRSPGGIPSLAGRPASVLQAQMLAYKSESSPPGTTIMNRLAKGYSDTEIEALAQYFSKLSPVAAPLNKGGR
jgi:sulfide dehydrogenase cytochrome subunit